MGGVPYTVDGTAAPPTLKLARPTFLPSLHVWWLFQFFWLPLNSFRCRSCKNCLCQLMLSDVRLTVLSIDIDKHDVLPQQLFLKSTPLNISQLTRQSSNHPPPQSCYQLMVPCWPLHHPWQGSGYAACIPYFARVQHLHRANCFIISVWHEPQAPRADSYGEKWDPGWAECPGTWHSLAGGVRTGWTQSLVQCSGGGIDQNRRWWLGWPLALTDNEKADQWKVRSCIMSL